MRATYSVWKFGVGSIVRKGGSAPSVGMGLRGREGTSCKVERIRSRTRSHTHDWCTVWRIPSDTDPRGDVVLGVLVLRRDDDCGRGKFLRGRWRGFVVVFEAEGSHELDERRQRGHCSGRGGEEGGRGALGDLGEGERER